MPENLKYLVVSIFLILTSPCFAISKDSIINEIKVTYQEIESHRELLNAEVHDLYDEPYGSGQITSFSDSNGICLIELFTPTDHDYRATKCYFLNGKLIYAIDSFSHYNTNEKNDTLNALTRSIEEANQYYFFNDILIEWVYPDQQKLVKIGGTNTAFSRMMIEADAQRVLIKAYQMKAIMEH